MVIIGGSFISPILFFHRWLSRGVSKSDMDTDTFVSKHGPLLMLPHQINKKGHTVISFLMPNKSLQSCLTLSNPMHFGPIGTSVHGILQATILEWVAISFSKRSSRPREWTNVSYISCMGRLVLYHYCQIHTCQILQIIFGPNNLHSVTRELCYIR